MRKVIPLQSKLRELDCWITGLRRNQSETRADIGTIELYSLDQKTGDQIVGPLISTLHDILVFRCRDHAQRGLSQ